MIYTTFHGNGWCSILSFWSQYSDSVKIVELKASIFFSIVTSWTNLSALVLTYIWGTYISNWKPPCRQKLRWPHWLLEKHIGRQYSIVEYKVNMQPSSHYYYIPKVLFHSSRKAELKMHIMKQSHNSATKGAITKCPLKSLGIHQCAVERPRMQP